MVLINCYPYPNPYEREEIIGCFQIALKYMQEKFMTPVF